ncbi:MerR family transcriptional regulator [Actinoplanes sp. CA-015351]|uniref:MerR family transcriptional regulator n=1 Tax=Actinoplanes sp. CA-015351 TaxID=3239897 RepID=UPI003D95A151
MMTIGEFSRRAGLSVKALRLYEASGLLPPADVDTASSYRLYSAGQLDRAARISLLRRLGMPIAVIGEVLNLPDAEAVQRLGRAGRPHHHPPGARAAYRLRRGHPG